MVSSFLDYVYVRTILRILDIELLISHLFCAVYRFQLVRVENQTVGRTKYYMKYITCSLCEGKGYREENNGPDDIEQVLCDECEGSGQLEVISF